MSLLNTTIERWKAETPDFFKGIKKVALTLGTSCASVWVVNDVMNLELHPYLLEACKYLIASAAAMGFTAQLTRVQKQENTEENPELQ
jgi:hypothetical protein